MKGVTEHRKQFVREEMKKYAVQLGIVPTLDSKLPITLFFTTSEANNNNHHQYNNQQEALRKGVENGSLSGLASKNRSNYLGTCFNTQSEIFINLRRKDMRLVKDIKDTIIHELFHYRFPGLSHRGFRNHELYNKLINLILVKDFTDKQLLESNIIREKKKIFYRKDGTVYHEYAYGSKLKGLGVKVRKRKFKYTIRMEITTCEIEKKNSNVVVSYPALYCYTVQDPNVRYTLYYNENLKAEEIDTEFVRKYYVESVKKRLKNRIKRYLYRTKGIFAKSSDIVLQPDDHDDSVYYDDDGDEIEKIVTKEDKDDYCTKKFRDKIIQYQEEKKEEVVSI